jgi:hypothetical protein
MEFHKSFSQVIVTQLSSRRRAAIRDSKIFAKISKSNLKLHKKLPF